MSGEGVLYCDMKQGQKIKISVLDDENTERSQICQLLQECLDGQRSDWFKLVDFAEEAAFLQDVEQEPADVFFLDIYLDGEARGVDIARQVRKFCPNSLIVFLTSSPEFALEGYSIQAVNYCLKPVSKAKIEECLRRCEQLIPNWQRKIAIQTGYDGMEIPTANILYIDSYGHIQRIHLQGSSEPMEVRQTMAFFEENLIEDCFLRVNRSVIINMDYVIAMEKNEFVLKNGERIVMSRSQQPDLQRKYKEYFFMKMRKN